MLFQGVTGSGKTEIYMELISKAIESGDQVLSSMLPKYHLLSNGYASSVKIW